MGMQTGPGFHLRLRGTQKPCATNPILRMSLSLIPRPLRGVIPPLPTPLLGIDVLDMAGLERLIEHVIRGGVAGLFILGTTGEGPSLSYRLRRELIERT